MNPATLFVVLSAGMAGPRFAAAQGDGCDGFGVTWGPGVGPPPTGCDFRGGLLGGGTAGGGGGMMGGGGGGSSSSSSSSAHAASMLGDVARTTVTGTDARSGVTFAVGENVYGPFEAGFSSRQNGILEGMGCANGEDGHVAGGIDTHTAEQMVAAGCGITLPRIEGGQYISLLDECGGHTMEYHFHERLSCLYDTAAPGHSTQVAEASDGQLIYGKWEATETPPELDACGGHFGVTPDSGGVEVYHYHVQDKAPFTVGCLGPNDDGSLVTVQQCRDFYSGCDGDLVELNTANRGTIEYDLWCPCYDAAGSNTGVDIQPLAVFAGAGAGGAPEPAGTTTEAAPEPVGTTTEAAPAPTVVTTTEAAPAPTVAAITPAPVSPAATTQRPQPGQQTGRPQPGQQTGRSQPGQQTGRPQRPQPGQQSQTGQPQSGQQRTSGFGGKGGKRGAFGKRGPRSIRGRELSEEEQ